MQIGTLKLEVQTWLLESEEKIPSNKLVEKFLVQVKEEGEKLSFPEDILKELIYLILVQRKNNVTKPQIWMSVRWLSQTPLLWKWKYGKPRTFVSPQLRDVFDLIFSYLPLPSRRPRKRKRREYPIEKIKELKKKGLSVRKIAKELGIPKSTIHRLLKKL